jgi:hypothetical protein
LRDVIAVHKQVSSSTLKMEALDIELLATMLARVAGQDLAILFLA